MSTCIRRPHAVWTTCKCDPCHRDRLRMAKLARNGRVSRVPVEVAWEAFRNMAEQGWSGRAIASATGIGESSVESALSRLRAGRTQRFGARASTALVNAGKPTAGMVGAHGARRRLQGLARLGWTLRELEVGTGIGYTTLAAIRQGTTRTVHAEMHNTITDYTKRLALKVGPSSAARITAERKGWPPLLAWDEIDNVREVPHVGKDHYGADIDDIVWLVRCGGTWASISERMGVTKDGIDRALRRAGRLDVIAELARGGSRNQWNGEVAS